MQIQFRKLAFPNFSDSTKDFSDTISKEMSFILIFGKVQLMLESAITPSIISIGIQTRLYAEIITGTNPTLNGLICYDNYKTSKPFL
jgi:hypothetical protein